MVDRTLKPLAKGDGVLAGDEAVARIEVQAQIGRIAEGQHLRQAIRIGRKIAVNLDIDRDLVGLGHSQDLAIAAFHEFQGFVVGQVFRLVQSVGRGDPRAAGQLGPRNRLENVGHAVERAIAAGERKGGV